MNPCKRQALLSSSACLYYTFSFKQELGISEGKEGLSPVIPALSVTKSEKRFCIANFAWSGRYSVHAKARFPPAATLVTVQNGIDHGLEIG